MPELPLELRHFDASEFRHPELMNVSFLKLLGIIRIQAGIPFFLTSDARTPEENERVGGSPRSLHLQGRAVDFVVRPWTPENLFRLVRAVGFVSWLRYPQNGGIEFELVQSPIDRHVHLGLFPDERPSRLILALD